MQALHPQEPVEHLGEQFQFSTLLLLKPPRRHLSLAAGTGEVALPPLDTLDPINEVASQDGLS